MVLRCNPKKCRVKIPCAIPDLFDKNTDVFAEDEFKNCRVKIPCAIPDLFDDKH